MKIKQKKINGILLLDKPTHMTSNGALQYVKRLLNAKKAGHTGSLDPLATGMLPICFGEATKFSQFLLESDKYYRVSAQLGVKTTTGDSDGDMISTQPVTDFTRERLEAVLPQFNGPIQQIPPMYSAVKYQGKPLYQLARQGLEIERQSRSVEIYRLNIIEVGEQTFCLDVHCSKGTYIRTLIEDIGAQLGYGAHVIALRRLAVVPYLQDKMYSLPVLEALYQESGEDALTQHLLPVESSLHELPEVRLSVSSAFYIRAGQSVLISNLVGQGFVRLYSDTGQFMGVGEIQDDKRLAPRRLVDFS